MDRGTSWATVYGAARVATTSDACRLDMLEHYPDSRIFRTL